MAQMIEVKSQRRSKLAKLVLDEINNIGQDNIITVVMHEGGKFAEYADKKMLSSLRAYIYYKD